MIPAMTRNWIVVASVDHMRRGRDAGFMQACHGKAAPLRRLHPGDLVACYSPTLEFRGKEKCQSFTAFGIVGDTEPCQVDVGGAFRPYRRGVTWLEADGAPIRPLVEDLEFTTGKRNWGYVFRFGLFAVSDHDIGVIARAMGAQYPPGRAKNVGDVCSPALADPPVSPYRCRFNEHRSENLLRPQPAAPVGDGRFVARGDRRPP
jgi:hypothetical protein